MNKKTILILILLLILIVSTYTVAYANGTKSVNAYVNPKITININGAKFTPFDIATGEPMDILIYNGRTYLPVRSLAEATNSKIAWDEKTQTVYIQH